MSKKVILLIDDDAVFLMLTRRLLQKQPFLERIDTCTTVEESLAYFQQLEERHDKFPDAVFIDLDMPQTDGLELAAQLKDTYLMSRPEIKLYILSSSISQRDRQAVANTDFISDYMEKPLSPEILSKTLGLEAPQSKDRESISNAERQMEEESGKTPSKTPKER